MVLSCVLLFSYSCSIHLCSDCGREQTSDIIHLDERQRRLCGGYDIIDAITDRVMTLLAKRGRHRRHCASFFIEEVNKRVIERLH